MSFIYKFIQLQTQLKPILFIKDFYIMMISHDIRTRFFMNLESWIYILFIIDLMEFFLKYFLAYK